MLTDDRYRYAAQILKNFGWVQDFLLRNARNYVVSTLKQQGVESVLDACCGAGTLSAYLYNAGISVTGVDASPSMLSLARRKVPDTTFIEADLTVFRLDEPVEGSVIAFSLHEMPEETRMQVWKAIKTATKPGGPIVVLDFTRSKRNTIGAKIAWAFINTDEKNSDRHDPGHYTNFLEFMDCGGAKGWLIDHGETVNDEHYFMWGTIGVFALNA